MYNTFGTIKCFSCIVELFACSSFDFILQRSMTWKLRVTPLSPMCLFGRTFSGYTSIPALCFYFPNTTTKSMLLTKKQYITTQPYEYANHCDKYVNDYGDCMSTSNGIFVKVVHAFVQILNVRHLLSHFLPVN